MESVRLEIVAAVAIQPMQAMRFVQELRGVPEDALCEIVDVYARPTRETAKRQQQAASQRMQTDVQLSCERAVADFMCKKFSEQRRHVLAGEIALVQCRRAPPDSRSVKGTTESSELAHVSAVDESSSKSAVAISAQEERPTTTLSVEKVVAVIEVLGDRVVDARDAYDAFADAADASQLQRLSVLGLSKALARICASEWTVKQTRTKTPLHKSRIAGRHRNDSHAHLLDTTLAVANLRRLLTRLIASDAISLRALPSDSTSPCLSYTDFLACVAAFLALLHAEAPLRSTSTSQSLS